MVRLPIPGQDDGAWGDLLNEFLAQAHTSTGGLKSDVVNASTIQDGTISETLLDTAVQNKLNAVASGGVVSVNGQSGTVVLTKNDIGLGAVDNTSDASKPISTATATALSDKASASHTHTASNISDSTTTGRSVLTATDAAAARVAIGAGTSSLALGTSSSTAKAGDYTPTKADVGLSNVDNTSDVAKPISTATQTALDSKAALSHAHTASSISDSTAVGRSVLTATDAAAARTVIGAGTSSLVLGTSSATAKAGDYTPTKTDVGLSNVDNTSDASKPISTATQTALDLKADATTVGAKVLLINNVSSLPPGTGAGVIVVVKA